MSSSMPPFIDGRDLPHDDESCRCACHKMGNTELHCLPCCYITAPTVERDDESLHATQED